MKLPCVAVDISKGVSHIQGFVDAKESINKAYSIEHTDKGFKELGALIKKLEDLVNREVIVAFESTGVYDKQLQKFLMDNSIRYVAINPLLSARYRKKSLRGVKTDKKDCANIAKVYFQEELSYQLLEANDFHELRYLNRYYEENMDHLRKYKVNFHESLEVVWPGITKEFSNLFTELPLKFIKEFKHPYNLKKRRLKTVSNFIRRNSTHREGWCKQKAYKLLEYANTCQPGCDMDSIETTILNDKIEMIIMSLNKVETILEVLISKAKEHPNFDLLRSIPGIGDNIASRLLAEIGDIKRFNNNKQLVAYAGLDPIVYQSGTYSAQWSISKKGNKRLRCLLYLAVSCGLRLRSDSNSIKDYYKRKTQLGKPHKVALISCCNKLLRIIYSMCINNTQYVYT